jgi:hypothetical protein
MSKFELSITPDYVADWTVSDAIRELFQNAIDQEVVNPSNKMFFNYDEDTETISVGNKESILEPKSLLLGASSKSDNDSTIGKFGEGYKIGTVVLLRNDKKVTFYNYGVKEVWQPRFVNSRRYGTKIPVFEISKNHFWNRVPDNNLTIVVEGITLNEYEEIKNNILYLQDKEALQGENIIETSYGKILLDDKYKSRIFVNGLYVSTNNNFKYGYDIKPKHLKLDRDRKLIPDYDLSSVTSYMWTSSDRYDLIEELLDDKYPDVQGLGYKSGIGMRDDIHNRFKKKYGENAIPVTSTYEIEGLQKGYKPIIVNYTYKDVITGSRNYEKPKEVATPKEKLVEWIEIHQEVLEDNISEEELDKLMDIIELL